MQRSEDKPKSQFADLDPAYVEEVYVQVLRYATFRTRSKDRGRDLAHDVLLQALDPAPSRGDRQLATWDRERNPDLAGYLVGQVDGAIARERKAARLRRSPEVVSAVRAQLYAPPPTPEQLLQRREDQSLHMRLWAELRDDFAAAGDDGSRIALAVMDQYENGADDAQGQARALGVDIQAIYLARARVQRRAQALGDRERARESDLDGEGPDAMPSVYENDDSNDFSDDDEVTS